MHAHTQSMWWMCTHKVKQTDRGRAPLHTVLLRDFTPPRAAFTLTFLHTSGACSGVVTRQKRRKIVECAF